MRLGIQAAEREANDGITSGNQNQPSKEFVTGTYRRRIWRFKLYTRALLHALCIAIRRA